VLRALNARALDLDPNPALSRALLAVGAGIVASRTEAVDRDPGGAAGGLVAWGGGARP
jgi:hypothetical protein